MIDRRAFYVALALAASVAIPFGCSQASTGGYGPLSDPTENVNVSAGGTSSSGGSAGSTVTSECPAYQADAGNAPAFDPDAGFTASPCQPTGHYTTMITNVGTCDSAAFPKGANGDYDGDTSMPYPFSTCVPEIPIFTATACSVYIPTGTVCTVGSTQFTIDACAYFECNADASECETYLSADVNDGSTVCHTVQTVTYTR